MIPLVYITTHIPVPKSNDWRDNYPMCQYKNWNTEQRIYYKIMLHEIKRDAPYKGDEEIETLATLLVSFSKHIPYYTALIYTESVLPGKWKHRRGKIITIRKPQFWHNFTIRDDGGSPSIGYPKIKLSTIRSVCRMRGERPPRSIWEIDIHKIYWKVKIFDWSATHFDYIVSVFKNEIDAIGAYKYGIKEYKRWKRRRWQSAYPWKYIGDALIKVARYQRLYIEYAINH